MAFVPKITINETDEGFVHPYSQTPFATREAMWADLQQHFSPKHDWQRQDIDYVEKGTHGQPFGWPGGSSTDRPTYSPKEKQYIKDRVAWVRKTGVPASDEQVPPPHSGQLRKQKYVEEATEGQWGKNDQKWGLIRMGMDARDQERSKQEQELGRSNGSRGHFDAGHT
jgi:hypothetical protein